MGWGKGNKHTSSELIYIKFFSGEDAGFWRHSSKRAIDFTKPGCM